MANSPAPSDPPPHSVHFGESRALNRDALEELAWAIEMGQGEFTLLLARCNYARLQRELADQLQQICAVPLTRVELPTSALTLYTALQEALGDAHPEAVMVFGLEQVQALAQVLVSTNQVRDDFRATFPFPLVLWVNDDVLKQLIRQAPDFHSWSTLTDLAIAPDNLLRSLWEGASELFSALLVADSPVTFRRRYQSLNLDALKQGELRSAIADLNAQHIPLPLPLEASLHFIQGIETSDSTDAIAHFQKSLELWQHLEIASSPSAPSPLPPIPLLTALTRYYLGNTLYYLHEKQRDEQPDWQPAREFLEQAIAQFEQLQRPDLVAQCVTPLERLLHRLQAWDDLDALAQRGLQLHQRYQMTTSIAKDHGFLAEAALHRQQ